jgi:hypothetical protein
LALLSEGARRLGHSGVDLKDESERAQRVDPSRDAIGAGPSP